MKYLNQCLYKKKAFNFFLLDYLTLLPIIVFKIYKPYIIANKQFANSLKIYIIYISVNKNIFFILYIF